MNEETIIGLIIAILGGIVGLKGYLGGKRARKDAEDIVEREVETTKAVLAQARQDVADERKKREELISEEMGKIKEKAKKEPLTWDDFERLKTINDSIKEELFEDEQK